MWIVVLLVLLAIVTGVFGALVEGLLWLIVISVLLVLAAALLGRARGGSTRTVRGRR